MTTLNLQTGASSDDARENGGTMGLTATTLLISGPGHILGFRWTGVTIPQGTTLTSATLSFYVTGTADDTPNGVAVAAQAADNAGTFTTATNDISGRSLTSTVTWSGSNIGAGWQTIDVTTPIQAVINRAGWVSGNALVVIVTGVTGASIRVDAYDGTPANAAKLDIVYTSGGGNTPVKMHHLMMQGIS